MAYSTSLVFELLTNDRASKGFLSAGNAAVLAATKAGKAETAFERAGIRMQTAGEKLSKSFTLPIVAAAAVAVDQAAKFQAGLNTIAVATDQTTKQMAASSKGLLSIATGTGTSLDQLTQSLYTVEKGGFRGAKALDVVKASAQGAKAEGADLGTATQALTSIMASYGKSLGSPVQAENALIRGAGLAKTTYQDFAASLSNVVPIASSLHISFGQVAGAVDTMTQHGETAQRATENLANLITNLAGQNTVASSAMQQLGISTIDLQKNLGTRGLTGTLAIVDAAMKAHTKNGMIVSSASKDAALATKSLDTEMGTFTGTLQNQSKGLLSGKVGITNYQQYAKSLGGTAGASALQFLALYKSSQGFSDQLKSGNGTIRTSAATLQKMLGGVTGMRTALMLGGTSAARFAQDTSAVAAAADKAGANVLGWSKTQDTFNVKLDQAKESLQVLAVQAGTELLPVLAKIATAGENAISWTSNLSHGQKEVAGWSIGILAAAGPVLSLSGRLFTVGASITRFSTSAVSQLARFNTGVATNAEGISSAVGRIGSAVGAAGLGVVVGELTKNSSSATKAVGVLGSALAGAAIGSAGGPWGIAIGAAAGAVGDLATQWLSSGSAAKSAAAEAIAASAAQKRAVDSLYQSLQSVNGAYGQQYKKQVAQQLLNNGAAAAALAAHINPNTVLQATLGNTKAQTAVANQIGADQKSITEYGPDGSAQIAPMNAKAFAAASKLNKIMIASGAATSGAEKKYELYLATEGAGVVTAAQLAKGVSNVSREMKGYGTSLSTSTAYGVRNNAVIRANVQALNTSAVAQLAQHKSISTVTADYESQIGSLAANLHQMGFNSSMIDTIIGKYAKIPKSVATKIAAQTGNLSPLLQSILAKYAKFPTSKNTTISVSTGSALANIHTVQDALNGMHGVTVAATVANLASNKDHGANAAGSKATYRRADGTIPPNTTFTVGEGASHTWEGGMTDAQGRARIFSNAHSKALGFPTPKAYATGSLPSGITTTMVGKDKKWQYGDTKYASLTSAENARTSALTSAHKTAIQAATSRVSGLISGVGQSASPQFTVSDAGVVRVLGQLTAAQKALDSAGLGKKATAKFQAQIKHLADLANRQLGALQLKIRKSDLDAVSTALTKTPQDARTAFQGLDKDIKAAGASAAQVTQIQAVQTRLLAQQATYLKAQGQLASMRAYRSSISSTLSGSSDFTTSGSVADLVSSFTTATSTNNAYKGEVSSLIKAAHGNKAQLALINYLDKSGQSASLTSLAGQPSALTAAATAYAGYTGSVAAGADTATTGKYGKSVEQERKDAAADRKDMRDGLHAIAAAVAHIGDAKIEIDGKVIATIANKETQREIHNLLTAAGYGNKKGH